MICVMEQEGKEREIERENRMKASHSLGYRRRPRE